MLPVSEVKNEVTDTVVIPHIRTSKRRVVAKSDRKRALFSCDRCKVKKIGCQRVSDDGLQHDSKTACVQCKKLNLECKTTIKRKKRVHGPIENIGLHYKCLITVLRGLYPDKDMNSIDTLIELGESLNLKMPSRDGLTNEEEEEELKDIAILLTSSKKRPKLQRFKSSHSSSPEDDLSSQLDSKQDGIATTGAPPRTTADDSVIVDHGGNTHYIGPLGAPLMISTLFAVLSRTAKNKTELTSVRRTQKRSTQENIINSKQLPLNAEMFKNSDLDNFPMLNILGRPELDHYVRVFFDKIHPVLYCFGELEFLKNYQVFWAMIKDDKKQKLKLTNAQVCCVYMVWILARQMVPYSQLPESNGVMELDDYVLGRYLDIIKITLSEILLTPSLDGIRCMILLSIYMDNNKRRETGYILIELLLRQLVSIGLNRKSLFQHMKSIGKNEELKKTWWVLFKHEMRFSNQMGRATCLQIEDINVELPKFPEDAVFQQFVEEEIKLNKIMYGLLQYRKKLFLNNELLSLINMEKLIDLKKQFNVWFDNLPPSLLRYDLNPTLYKCNLHLQYHYYFITLSLPFLIYFSIHSQNLKVSNDDPILDLICQCVNSSISIANLFTFTDNNGFFNGTIQVDLFYCYHASMSLVLFYLLSSLTKAVDMVYLTLHYGISIDKVEQSLQMIKMLNKKNADGIKGSLQTISELIEVMITDLEIIVRSHNFAPLAKAVLNEAANDNANDTEKTSLNLANTSAQQRQQQQEPLALSGNSDIFEQQNVPVEPQLVYNYNNTTNNNISNLNGDLFANSEEVLPDNGHFNINDFAFAVDNQLVLDNDMMDLFFGGDLFGLYNIDHDLQRGNRDEAQFNFGKR